MKQQDIRQMFDFLKNEIHNEFPEAFINKKIKGINISITRFSDQSHPSYSYQNLKNIPAFYEHDTKKIILNEELIKRFDKTLILNIIYHEFLHALSFRKMRKLKGRVILTSGFFTQIFEKNKSKDLFRLLNEGIVQYFANKKTGLVKNSGYRKEALAISKIVEIIGEQNLKKLFFQGKFKEFKKILEFHFGKDYISSWK